MSTNLVLARSEHRADGIFGVLTDSVVVFAHTLEHAYPDGAGGWMAKIPTGIFTCVRGEHSLSNGVPFITFEVTGVPGHSGLLLHAGNFNKDSEGCVLLGEQEIDSNGQHMVTASRAAFASFMQRLYGVDQFQLTVTE